MSSPATRRFLLDALERASAVGIRKHPGRAAFLAGRADIEFGELEMDSLARMELCIAIEVRTGVEMPSEQLEEIGSLARLAEILEK